jgi:hypothetical protein
MTKKKTSCVTAAEEPSRLTAAIVEMADDQLRSGLMNDATYTKIVGRLLGAREAEQQLAARRLAALGGTMPDLKPIPRRKTEVEHEGKG